MSQNIKKITVVDEEQSQVLITRNIGVDAENVDCDANTNLVQKLNAIDSNINTKMNHQNPEGTGYLSLNRYENTTDPNHADNIKGINSIAVGNYNIATGEASFAEGRSTKAVGRGSHAEGDTTIAGQMGATINDDVSPLDVYQNEVAGAGAHAEGIGSNANYAASHAEGYKTQANEVATHAEGIETEAKGRGSHAEGEGSWAYREYCHAEGCRDDETHPTIASCKGAHAEGIGTVSSGNGSHSEGRRTQALREASHAEGRYTIVEGDCGHAEGENTKVADGAFCGHAEGYNTIAGGDYSHVQGKYNVVDNENRYAHIVGGGESDSQRENIHTLDWSGNAVYAGDVIATVKAEDGTAKQVSLIAIAEAAGLHPEQVLLSSNPTGLGTFSFNRKLGSDVGAFSVAMGSMDVVASGDASYAEGYETTASGAYSHAEGQDTTASGDYSHAEGGPITYNDIAYYTTALGAYSHAEGAGTTAGGDYSHAEGYITTAGNYAHAEGYNTTAADYAHAEGRATTAVGHYSHAEGLETDATGHCSHAENYNTTALGDYSHAEGYETKALKSYSHAEGQGTIAAGPNQHVQGKYNVEDGVINPTTQATEYQYAHIVGGGTSNTDRKNIHTLDWDGNAWFAGDVRTSEGITGQNFAIGVKDEDGNRDSWIKGDLSINGGGLSVARDCHVNGNITTNPGGNLDVSGYGYFDGNVRCRYVKIKDGQPNPTDNIISLSKLVTALVNGLTVSNGVAKLTLSDITVSSDN